MVLYPVVYQFCANWDAMKKEVPPKFDEINQVLRCSTDVPERLA